MAVLVGRFRQSKRLAGELFEMINGVPLPASTICDMEKPTRAALATPVEAVKAHRRARTSSTPTIRAGGWTRTRPVWLVATERVAFYWIDRRRSGQVIRGILGDDFDGVGPQS